MRNGTDIQSDSSEKRPPNIVLFLVDEWRAQAVGYNGDVNVETPVLDAFAAESVNFRQAVSGHSVCCPARASFLTGQYPLTNGVYINDVPLQPRGTTLGQAFTDAGYATGWIGKWHLFGSPDGRYGRRGAYIPPEFRFGFEYWKAAECTHDYNHSIYYEGNDPTPRFWSGYDALAQAEDASRFIKDRAGDSRPYFLTLSLGPPHFPLDTAPAEYKKRYADRPISLRANVPDSCADVARAELRGYYAHMAALDDCLSVVLDAVEASGAAADTVVVFTSDHGDMMWSHGMQTKLFPWEESVRVPLLIRYPSHYGTHARASDAPFDSPDLMPTLLGLAGIPVPDGVQGVDRSGLEPGGGDDLHPTAFLSLPVPITGARRAGIAEYRGVRSRRYTYVATRSGPWLLYDNVEDPYQMCNLAGDPSMEAVQAELAEELSRWLARLDDEFLPASEYLAADGLDHYAEVSMPVGHMVSPWGDWSSTLT